MNAYLNFVNVETKVLTSQWVGKGSPWPQKAQESVKDQDDVGCVFWLQRQCPSKIYTTWSDSKQGNLSRNFSTFEGCCAHPSKAEKPDLDIASWQCSCTCVTPCLQLSGETSDSCCAPSTYSPDLAPADFFCLNHVSTWFF